MPLAYIAQIVGWLARACAAAFLILAFLGGPAAAQFQGPTSTRTVTTVEQAKTARLGRDVVLTGNIVKHLWADYYQFRDKTGEIRVEIERHQWRGRRVDAGQLVRLRGDVSRSFRGRYISVDRMQLLN